jgi:DNA-binding XRE family transcriptional regulator
MHLYRDRNLPDSWVVEDSDGVFWIVPAHTNGWAARSRYKVPLAMHEQRLSPVQPFFALGVGIPGLPVPFGDRLRLLRERANLTAQALADVASIGRTYVHDLESGRKSPSWDVVCRLAAALSVTPDAFLRDD